MNAFPIVALVAYLIGFIIALQSAAQLRQFGASIFVADLVAISMTREMGPIMTAIVFAGRSGSSIASEIATMVVTEETDALKSMALNPIRCSEPWSSGSCIWTSASGRFSTRC
jgi:phospholipid/cholesterol/gamma-HCH transport system permease protein